MNKESEKIILGIDPGTRIMGYGVISVKKNKMTALQYGVINLSKYTTHELKLKKIFERVTSVIDEYLPDEVALEAPFYGKNVQSMLKLGRAQGVAMTAALMREIPITEYAPLKVKKSVTGKGSASKEELANMIEYLLHVKFDDKTLLDATDALGVAICHHYQSQSGVKVGEAKSWAAFVKENPDRLK